MARINVLADLSKSLKANIHAVENFSPITRFAVYIRAGSRYEPDHLPGVSHHIRASAGLTTEDSSMFGIARHMERSGASFVVTSDREFIVYRVACLRNAFSKVIGFIDDTIHKPEFRSWELFDHVQPRLKFETEQLKKNQYLVTNEAMHKAAFRGGLAHSLFTPEFRIEKLKKDHLFEYLENNYVLSRMSFIGMGTNEEQLRDLVEGRFSLNGSEFKGVSGATRYVGGEARIQAGFPSTQVNYVLEGPTIRDTKLLAALEVLGNLIGNSKEAPIKYGKGPDGTLANLMKNVSPAIETSVINLNYSDTGLFGFSIIGPNEHLKGATKAAVKHVRKQLSGISDSNFKAAKARAKARALVRSENQDKVFEAICRQYANQTLVQNPIDHIDTLKLDDVQKVADKILRGNPTLVSVGNPRFVPYIDELD